MKREVEYKTVGDSEFHKIKSYKRALDFIDTEEKSIEKLKVFSILKKIYQKNVNCVFGGGKEPINSHLLNLVASLPLLVISYNKLVDSFYSGKSKFRSCITNKKKQSLKLRQNNLTGGNLVPIDVISIQIFQVVSDLLRRGRYPWGSKNKNKVCFIKSGKSKNHSLLTIPLLFDEVVQIAIRFVLEAIYEPFFDNLNCSFASRPNKTRYDVIYILTSDSAKGLNLALESSIKPSYTSVSLQKLMEILGKKIKDRKFLNLIKQRLGIKDYNIQTGEYKKESFGISLDGADSPYFWNIYMLEFDQFVVHDLKRNVDKLNFKVRGIQQDRKTLLNIQRAKNKQVVRVLEKFLLEVRKLKKARKVLPSELRNLYENLQTFRKEYFDIFNSTIGCLDEKVLKELNLDKLEQEKDFLKQIQCYKKKLLNIIVRMPYLDPNKKLLKFLYVRFDDKLVILSNMKRFMVEQMKEKIIFFLLERFSLSLLEEETFVKDIHKKTAYFLEFGIRSCKNVKIGKYIQKQRHVEMQVSANIASSRVFAIIDEQRQIDRMFIRGFCDKTGFPRELSRLVNLDIISIIERFNSVLSHLVDSYVYFIKSPKTSLSRLIYILRYSCFKTLAQKYKLTLRGVFKKFKLETKYEEDQSTVAVLVKIKVGVEVWEKAFKLHTIKSLFKDIKSEKKMFYRKFIEKTYRRLAINLPVDYEAKIQNIPLVSDDYLEKINGFDSITHAIFDGISDIFVYNFKRKNFSLRSNLQSLRLSNKREIPVYKNHSFKAVKNTDVFGRSFTSFLQKEFYDDKVVNIELYVRESIFEKDYRRNLIQKGWVQEK